jgi:hypothetical protein
MKSATYVDRLLSDKLLGKRMSYVTKRQKGFKAESLVNEV